MIAAFDNISDGCVHLRRHFRDHLDAELMVQNIAGGVVILVTPSVAGCCSVAAENGFCITLAKLLVEQLTALAHEHETTKIHRLLLAIESGVRAEDILKVFHANLFFVRLLHLWNRSDWISVFRSNWRLRSRGR